MAVMENLACRTKDHVEEALSLVSEDVESDGQGDCCADGRHLDRVGHVGRSPVFSVGVCDGRSHGAPTIET